jgi:hypothetical protein
MSGDAPDLLDLSVLGYLETEFVVTGRAAVRAH